MSSGRKKNNSTIGKNQGKNLVSGRTDLAMLFSGGLDTTAEVIKRLETHRNIHLLTFNNGYCINMGGVRKRVTELKGTFGENRFTYTEIDISKNLKSYLSILEASTSNSLPRSPLLFDLACKTASLTALIIHAGNNHITDLTDGVAAEQDEIFLQQKIFLDHVKPFFSEWGLNYLHPIMFEATREEKMNLLRKYNLRTGIKALENFFITSGIMHQPFCLRGIMTFFFTSPLRNLPVVANMSLSVEEAKIGWDILLPHVRERITEGLYRYESLPGNDSEV